MGTVASMTYKQLRRLANRYNAEHRAHKFLSRDKLPTPPRHKSFALPKLSGLYYEVQDIFY